MIIILQDFYYVVEYCQQQKVKTSKFGAIIGDIGVYFHW